MSLRDGGFPSKQSPSIVGDSFAIARNDMQRIETSRATVHAEVRVDSGHDETRQVWI